MRKLEELSKKELILLIERYENILSLRAANAELENGSLNLCRPRRKEVSEDGIVLDNAGTNLPARDPQIL